jgi:hypothetical protein
VKRDEIRRGVGADGAKLLPVKPTSRPDGATGKPLDPHYAESRTYRLLAAHQSADGVTLFWRGHGRQSWTTILGYHADGLVRGAPVRDTIGISPAGRRKIKDSLRSYWKASQARKPKAGAGTAAKPARKAATRSAAKAGRTAAPTPAATTTGELVGSGRVVGRVHYRKSGEGYDPRSKRIQVVVTGRGRKAEPPAPPKPPKPVVPPAPRLAAPKPKAVPRVTPKLASFTPKPPVLPAPLPPPAKPPAPAPVAPAAPSLLAQSAGFARSLGIQVDAGGHSFLRSKYGDQRVQEVPAAYSPTTKTIYLNEQHPYWQNPRSLMDPASASKWFSSGSDEHAIVHEIGHAVHNALIGDTNYQRVRAHKFRAEQAALVKAEVSGYAATQPVEFVAELYAALKSGKTFSPEVMALYRRFGGPTP